MRIMVLTGRLTDDPELREFTDKEDAEKKLQRLTLSLANNDNGKDRPPEFFDVVCWGNLATWGSNYLKKGTRVLVSGTPHNESYESKVDNKKKTRFKLTAERFDLIG